MILFVFHFPAILLLTLNKPWHLIGCFVFSLGSSLAGKKRQFKAKMVRFAPIRANQITGTTSDFKMGVIERRIALVHEVILFRFYVTITTIVKLSQSFQQNHFHLLKSQKQKKAFFKVSLRFFPVLKWTTNSWRGIKKPLSLATTRKRESSVNTAQKFNRTKRRSDNGRSARVDCHIYRKGNKYLQSRC